MKKSLFIGMALVAVVLGFGVKPANAQYGCDGQYGQYGGCPPAQSIVIDKTVGQIDANGNITAYVDNLSPSDIKFKAGQYISFQLKVKNTSNVVLNNIKVVDSLPNYLLPIEGPGTYDANANPRTITFTIDTLNVNEEKLYTIKMQVKPLDQINAINEAVCVPNKAAASVDSAYDEDTAQFCVEKSTATTITGVTQVPSTGAEDLPILVASISALSAGIYLKKKARFK